MYSFTQDEEGPLMMDNNAMMTTFRVSNWMNTSPYPNMFNRVDPKTNSECKNYKIHTYLCSYPFLSGIFILNV